MREVGVGARGQTPRSPLPTHGGLHALLSPASPSERVVPLVRHVGARGNTTVYEWRTGLQPLRVERPELQEQPEQPKDDAVQPGLGGPCRAGFGCLSLDFWGDPSSFSPQIDWGDFTLEPSAGADGAAADGGAPGEEIDWGITLEPSPQVCDCVVPGAGDQAGDMGVSRALPSHRVPFFFAAGRHHRLGRWGK